MRNAILITGVLAAFVLSACSGDSQPSSGPEDVLDVGADVHTDDSGDVSDFGAYTDAGADLGVECDMAPTCDEPDRLVGCECLPPTDRACVVDSDCRDDETCRDVDGYKICFWEAPEAHVCPGGLGCEGEGDGVLYVGASSRIVTPQGFETPTPEAIDESNYLSVRADQLSDPTLWNDCGYDGLCPSDDGYPGPDEGEGDGIAQGMWLAGFGNGRPAQFCPDELIGCDEVECCVSKYAHDDIKSQVAVFRRGETTVAFVAVDVVGIFHSDIETVRRRVDEIADVDLLVMAATHNHQAPDFEGQWGPGDPFPERTGVDPVFKELVIAETVAGIVEAIDGLEEAEVSATVVNAGVEGMAMSDSRVPFIIDDNLPIVHARSAATGETIATLISWGNHAEILWSQNPHITSDFFGPTRDYIEAGLAEVVDGEDVVKPALPGVGGVTVMFAGAVGGLVYPGRGGAADYAGVPVPDERRFSWEASDAVGQTLASRVLEAIHGDAMTDIEAPDLRFATKRYLTDIENTVFQLAGFDLGLFERDIYNVTRERRRFRPGNPYVQTQASVIRLGPVGFFTSPGEMFPEMLVGGFPGKARVQNPIVGDIEERRIPATCDEEGLPTPNNDGTFPCIVSADAVNPPDWTATPDGPYGYELVPGEIPFFIGLGHDHLGYMVPAYDFETTYLAQADGDHYEETNSAGPRFYTDWRASFESIVTLVE